MKSEITHQEMKFVIDFPPSSPRPPTQPMGSYRGKSLPVSMTLFFISYHGFGDASKKIKKYIDKNKHILYFYGNQYW